MSPRSPRAARGRRGMLPPLAALLVPVLLATACTTTVRPTDAARSQSPSGSAEDAPLDVSRLRVPRTDLCGVLPGPTVAAALDGPVTRTRHYGNGDEFEVRPGYVDVSHEYGCVFEGPDGAVARAWVFARPVAETEARALVRRARHRRGCAFPESVRFGRPGLTSVCEVAGAKPSARVVRARLEGLFRDSWLGCEVSEPLDRTSDTASGPRPDVVQRAEQWCVGVVEAVSARS